MSDWQKWRWHSLSTLWSNVVIFSILLQCPCTMQSTSNRESFPHNFCIFIFSLIKGWMVSYLIHWPRNLWKIYTVWLSLLRTVDISQDNWYECCLPHFYINKKVILLSYVTENCDCKINSFCVMLMHNTQGDMKLRLLVELSETMPELIQAKFSYCIRRVRSHQWPKMRVFIPWETHGFLVSLFISNCLTSIVFRFLWTISSYCV